MRFIELFAGCGGLSLGLKAAGFSFVMGNELSPMAAESYAFNLLKEDLQNSKTGAIKKTLWLTSEYPKSQLSDRLRENPFDFPKLASGYCDLEPSGANLDQALVVGSIVELNNWLNENPSALSAIRNSFGRGSLELVSGGPPCQSFSMAGLREKDNQKNSLPWEFAKFVRATQPKFVLLENVTGILRPFKGLDGGKYYAWLELAKAFSKIGYISLCLQVNAKYCGVPQNRPRFILIGIREDIYRKLIDGELLNDVELEILNNSYDFYVSSKNILTEDISNLKCIDINEYKYIHKYKNTFLGALVTKSSNAFVSVKDAIDDLRSVEEFDSLNRKEENYYENGLNKIFSKYLNSNSLITNHRIIKSNNTVRRRFRLYQILEALNKSEKKEIISVLKGASHELSDDVWATVSHKLFLNSENKYQRFIRKEEFLYYLESLATKKQTQKALNPILPAPTALSIPDDACHYHKTQLRTLTVREMARIQSFPDRFVFKSKVTTGGKKRQFEVPQYTQVGNAVPPLLGMALGNVIKELISRINHTS